MAEKELFKVINLEQDEFAQIHSFNAADESHKFHIIVDGTNYNLMYRDGQFLGMPQRFGGTIYPFSKNPTKQGSFFQKRKFTNARIVVLSRGNKLLVEWGTGRPYMIEDPVTHDPYTVGAGGKFYVNIIPNNNGETANKFYLGVLSQGRCADQDSICAYLKPAFETAFGAKIQEYIQQENKSLENYVGLQPKELLTISRELFPRMKYVFEKFGLELVDESDEALLSQLVVNPA